MKENENKSKAKITFSAVIATVSLIVVIIALIPAFLSLNEKESELYYSYKAKHYETPEGIDDKLFNEFFTKNNIPRNLFSVQLKNGGNAPTKEIRLSVKTPGQIIRYMCNPSKKENPIWVKLLDDKEFGFDSGISKVVETIKDLSPNKLLVFEIAYEGSSIDNPQIEIFGDGIEAKYITLISEVPRWNRYRVFYLPGYILVGGLALTLIWIVGSVILKNEEYRELFANICISIGEGIVISLPFRDLLPAFKKDKKKEEQEVGSKMAE